MDYCRILSNIFSTTFSKDDGKDFMSCIEAANKHLDQKLESFNEKVDEARDTEVIALSKTIVWDVESTENVSNLVKMSKDRLSITSKSAFSTLKCNSCVIAGRYMYEVQLKSKGVMQIGFCSSQCKFTQDTGVGDTKYSYGLDGSKKRLWHVYTKNYGPYWRSGDIFGVCLDMSKGIIEYYRNGLSLGPAFEDIERGIGISLFPAVSLAFNDSLTANFGGSPFRYPVHGYKPLQLPPMKLLYQADVLLEYLVNIARLISSKHKESSTVPKSPTDISVDSLYMLISALTVERMIPLLINSYVVEDKIIKIIKSLCVCKSTSDSLIQPGVIGSTLEAFLSLLWTNMEDFEIKIFLKRLLNYLSNTFKETPTDLEYENQRTIIVILTCLCNHTQTRKFFLEHKFFKKNCLPLFLYIKPPDESTLELLLSDDIIWTEGLGGIKEVYLEACEKLKSYTSILYERQKKLILTLLNNVDGDENSPSSRKIFMNRFRSFALDNLSASFNTTTQPAIGLSLLCLLLDVAKQLHDEEKSEKPYLIVNHRYFYDNTFNYGHIDRVGGVMSHLCRVFKKELTNALGNEHQHIEIPPEPNNLLRDIYSTMFLVSTGNGTSTYSVVRNALSDQTNHQLTMPISPGNIDNHKSICEIIDCTIMFYQSVAYKYVVMIADLRDNISHLSNILMETKNCRDEVTRNLEEYKNSIEGVSSTHDEILKELSEKFCERKNIFAKRSIELARKQAWYRSVALGTQRRSLLCWLTGCVFKTIEEASSSNVLFSFVPEHYITVLPLLLDTILDFSFHDSGLQHGLVENQDLLDMSAEFLSSHLADSRVIIASCKDALIQALGTLTCHQSGIKALENCSEESQLLLVRALLRKYENRAWGQSNWIMLRFWLGENSAFAYRDPRQPCIFQDNTQTTITLPLIRGRQKNSSHTGLLHLIAPPCPSKHFQQLIRQVLIEDEQYSTGFLNSLLTQLNWAFSEFIHILQDIENLLQRDSQALLPDPRQLKICSMCFDLTISLMRALEMIVNIAPEIFKDSTRPNSDNLLGRVSQLVIQVLSRVTVPPSCFQFVIDLCLPDLISVTHFAILTAALGTILGLMSDELIFETLAKLPKVSRHILTDSSFQIACLEFALGEIKSTVHVPNADQPRGNFDPKLNRFVDPLTNEIRKIPSHRLLNERTMKNDPPILKFNLSDCE
ncbi:hypothetical protein ACKWTF_000697 [Chironomus riparius]